MPLWQKNTFFEPEMRKFTDPQWGYAIDVFRKISARKKYAEKARLEYFNFYVECTSSGAWLKTYFTEWLRFIKLWANLFYFQLFKPVKPGKDIEFVFLISNNNTYIQHLKGIINHYIAEGKNIIILCPANQFSVLQTKLDKDFLPYLVRLEQISSGGNFITKTIRWLYSFCAAITDGFWFWGQGVEKSFYFSSSFCRYSLAHHYFSKEFRQFFSTKRKLIAADDHWFWESLVFYEARETDSESFVLQHGVMGDFQYPMFAKKFLAWGKHDADRMVNDFGASSNEVEKAGSPFFDRVYLSHRDVSSTGQFDKPYITFLTQYFFDSPFVKPEHYREIIQRFYALQPIADKYNRKLVIKLHPLDKATHYNDRGENIILTREPLIDILEQSCIALTLDSTSIYETALLKIPIFQSHLKEITRFMDFSGFDLTIKTQSLDQQNESIDDLLSSELLYKERIAHQDKALGNFFFALGDSINTMAGIIDKG